MPEGHKANAIAMSVARDVDGDGSMEIAVAFSRHAGGYFVDIVSVATGLAASRIELGRRSYPRYVGLIDRGADKYSLVVGKPRLSGLESENGAVHLYGL